MLGTPGYPHLNMCEKIPPPPPPKFLKTHTPKNEQLKQKILVQSMHTFKERSSVASAILIRKEAAHSY
jgi:hypothetical protein